jgi:hypothetical protein
MATDYIHIDEAQENMKQLIREMNAFRDCSYAFSTACEEDGFGGVRNVDMKYISAAFKMYKKVLKEFGDE